MLRILFFLFLGFGNLWAQNPITDELTNFWREAERQVTEGDFEAYSKSFHPEAILVNGMNNTSIPSQRSLDGWKAGFLDTRAGIMKASVRFRFSDQSVGDSSAHFTGIFRYEWQNSGEESQIVFIHLEALLTRSRGQWQMLMEHQKALASEDEWGSLLPLQDKD
ncbi:MAG: hypothetical protein VW868_02170 [Bacteroidota bacterium]